jgi:hypothetical protein
MKFRLRITNSNINNFKIQKIKKVICLSRIYLLAKLLKKINLMMIGKRKKLNKNYKFIKC